MLSYVTIALTHTIRFIYRNFSMSASGARAQVISLSGVSDTVHVNIKVARPWKIIPGQYVYVWIPGLSFWSFAQSHPFMITWWRNDLRGRAKTITLLVKLESGCTQNLLRHIDKSFWVGIDGPYGLSTGFGDYGSVLMLATGIGVASQVPYIKALLNGHMTRKTVTRKIHLVWRLERECRRLRCRCWSRPTDNLQVIKSALAIGWTRCYQKMI